MQNFCILSGPRKKWTGMAPNGAGSFFFPAVTHPDLAGILGDTDFDFENLNYNFIYIYIYICLGRDLCRAWFSLEYQSKTVNFVCISKSCMFVQSDSFLIFLVVTPIRDTCRLSGRNIRNTICGNCGNCGNCGM